MYSLTMKNNERITYIVIIICLWIGWYLTIKYFDNYIVNLDKSLSEGHQMELKLIEKLKRLKRI